MEKKFKNYTEKELINKLDKYAIIRVYLDGILVRNSILEFIDYKMEIKKLDTQRCNIYVTSI